MKPPSYLQIAENEKIMSENSTTMDRIFGLLISSIDAVLTEEERFSFKDANHQEATEFLESMSQEQFAKVRKYMEEQPSLKHI